MAVTGTIGLLMIVILIGKNFKKIPPVAYIIIAIIAVIQVGIVLYVMYTMQIPTE